MDQNKYKVLIEMLEKVLKGLDDYKERTCENYEWIQSERKNLERDIKNLSQSLDDVNDSINILNNYKTILKNLFDFYYKKRLMLLALALIAILSLVLNVFQNPIMLLASVFGGLGITAVAGTLSFLIDTKHYNKIMRTKNLVVEEEKRKSLDAALEIKRYSLSECLETEQAFKERVEYIDNERSTYGMYLSNVIMAEGFANEQANGNVIEINDLFNNDAKTKEIMKLARKKLGLTEQK